MNLTADEYLQRLFKAEARCCKMKMVRYFRVLYGQECRMMSWMASLIQCILRGGGMSAPNFTTIHLRVVETSWGHAKKCQRGDLQVIRGIIHRAPWISAQQFTAIHPVYTQRRGRITRPTGAGKQIKVLRWTHVIHIS